MKIGDRIFVRGYIDEIRKDTVIVRNDGGYFGTVLSEVTGELPPAQPELIRCKDCKYSEHWYKDKTRCFLWHETGIDVFEDGYCNYAKRRTDEDVRGKQDDYEKKDIPLNTDDIFDVELAKRILNNK